MKIYNSSWKLQKQRSNNEEQEENELVQGEKNKFRPPYLQISYLCHSLFVLNKFIAMKTPSKVL
jgi:hypothetical protein